MVSIELQIAPLDPESIALGCPKIFLVDKFVSNFELLVDLNNEEFAEMSCHFHFGLTIPKTKLSNTSYFHSIRSN